MKLDNKQIHEYLPHRYPFLLVDGVDSLEPMKSVVGFKNVTINEPQFQGHFVGRPIFPGVLILEALAQVTALLGYFSLGIKGSSSEVLSYLAGVEKARFRRPVVPGDRLYLHAEVQYVRSQIARTGCKAIVDGQLCCSADIISAYK